MAYAIFLVWISGKVNRARKEQQNWPVPETLPSVSLIIPFRNEEKNLPGLVESLSGLQYPPNLLEIILVDDHSEDQGFSFLENAIIETNFQNVKLLKSPFAKSGKKAALDFAVQHAGNEYLLFTDADCQLPSFWINDLILVQFHEKAEMVCGPVKIKTRAFWQKLEMLETAALMATSASGILSGKPNFCNGANLLIRRTAYQEAQGKRKDKYLASGDDVFLLHQLQESKQKIAYCLLEHCGVETDAHKSPKELVNQKVRWAGKWKSGLQGSNQGLAISVWLFHACFLWVLFYFGMEYPLAAFLLYAFKNMGETLLVEGFCHLPGYQRNSSKVFLFQIPYSFYVLFMGIRVLASSSFEWKGRNYQQ